MSQFFSAGSASASSSFSKIGMQTFISSGTYTPTAGMKYCIVECIAGGGGSGGVAGSATLSGASGGGGGGTYARAVFSAANIGASQAVTVGQGGNAGNSSGSNGGPGSASSLGTLITSVGGSGGIGVPTPAASGTALGGLGASQFLGTGFTSNGADGAPGVWTATFAYSGSGGAAGIGAGGPQGQVLVATGSLPGITGDFFGSGCQGACLVAQASGVPGGVGGQGCVVITEFS